MSFRFFAANILGLCISLFTCTAHASAQPLDLEYRPITLSEGSWVVAYDKLTDLEWFAFSSHAEGLSLGFRVATSDDVRMLNRGESNLDQHIPHMSQVTLETPLCCNYGILAQSRGAYVMDQGAIAEWWITTRSVYFCDRRFTAASLCDAPPETSGGIRSSQTNDLSSPRQVGEYFYDPVGPLRVAMVRDVSAVPEPESAGMALVGVLALGTLARRRRASH
jgi:MYXO-CTERM domain-containing protein